MGTIPAILSAITFVISVFGSITYLVPFFKKYVKYSRNVSDKKPLNDINILQPYKN